MTARQCGTQSAPAVVPSSRPARASGHSRAGACPPAHAPWPLFGGRVRALARASTALRGAPVHSRDPGTGVARPHRGARARTAPHSPDPAARALDPAAVPRRTHADAHARAGRRPPDPAPPPARPHRRPRPTPAEPRSTPPRGSRASTGAPARTRPAARRRHAKARPRALHRLRIPTSGGRGRRSAPGACRSLRTGTGTRSRTGPHQPQPRGRPAPRSGYGGRRGSPPPLRPPHRHAPGAAL